MGDQRVDGSVTCIKTTESCLKFNQAVERCYGLRLCSVGIRMLTQHATCISKLRFTQGVDAKMTLNSLETVDGDFEMWGSAYSHSCNLD